MAQLTQGQPPPNGNKDGGNQGGGPAARLHSRANERLRASRTDTCMYGEYRRAHCYDWLVRCGAGEDTEQLITAPIEKVPHLQGQAECLRKLRAQIAQMTRMKGEVDEQPRYAASDREFQEACKKAGISATQRQASRWRNRQGKAYQFRNGNGHSIDNAEENRINISQVKTLFGTPNRGPTQLWLSLYARRNSRTESSTRS